MDTDNAPRRHRRKRPVPKSQRCKREGCTRRKADGHEYCNHLCYIVSDKIRVAELLCRMLGQGRRSQEFWLAAVELNDALTKFNHESARAIGAVEKAQNTA